MGFVKKAAMVMAAAISLTSTTAAPAFATQKSDCTADAVRIWAYKEKVCLSGKGTMAIDIEQVIGLETGPNLVRVAWVDKEGRLQSRVYDPGFQKHYKWRAEGVTTMLFWRVYQIWIL